MTTDEMLEDVLNAARGVPFENSLFQTENFIIKSEYTPARAYRAILLRLTNRIQALNEARYKLSKEDIDIEELEIKIHECEACGEERSFSCRRYKVDTEHKLRQRAFTKKLVEDAMVEVTYLYTLFSGFPRYTREKFEDEEKEHFDVSLKRQARGLSGPLDSLMAMGAIESPEDLRVSDELENLINKLNPKEKALTSVHEEVSLLGD